MLKRKVQIEFQNFIRSVLEDCEFNSKFGDSPVKFNEPIFGEKSPSFRSFIAPGLLNSTIYFVVVAMTAITMVKEKEEGLWNRMMAAGITPWQILVSHIMTTTVLVAMQTAQILVLSLFILGIECRGSVVLLAAHIFTNGVIGMAFGLLISLVCRNVGEANFLSTGSFYPYILLSGILWPLEGLPWYIYYLSRYLPLTLATESLRDIMEKGWGLSWPSVYAGYLATITWTIFYFACSYALLRFKKS
ncbi:hypothetical protein J437_LFUL014014 [Ladona fulva]|uniref:ABC transmembrane type-2 domain-containing protein n=1 Tax=Ladona fulva TaxID=123851 RepID=A0A8K0P732_LADFU|nr:hypothetical protein J437_LFUL014014 [Ladona fulva]